MFKIYSSKMCPDCRALKKNFDYYGIEYQEIDINESLSNLKAFLDLRDKLEVFDYCKEIGDIGLPALQKEDGEVFLNWEGYLKELNKEVLELDEKVEACSIDRKGC